MRALGARISALINLSRTRVVKSIMLSRSAPAVVSLSVMNGSESSTLRTFVYKFFVANLLGEVTVVADSILVISITNEESIYGRS
jgi:hypothetical protein